MVEPHRHLGYWSHPLRPMELMGTLEHLAPYKRHSHSQHSDPTTQTTDKGSYGLCCFSALFLGLAFKLSKRLDLISWTASQLGSISRPKHLPGHQASLQESTGILGMTSAMSAAC